MDEEMGERVKLTVIATGFREEMAAGMESHDLHTNVRTMPLRQEAPRGRVSGGMILPTRGEEPTEEPVAEEAPAVDPADREQPAFLRRKIE